MHRGRGNAFDRRPAGSVRQPIAARRRQHQHERRHRGARRGVRRNQRPNDGMRAWQARQRADAQQKRQRQGANTISADAAVAHDGEFLLAAVAAAETVGGVGKPVLMQAAGREQRCGDRKRRRRPRRQAEAMRQPINRAADQTDQKPRHRKSPSGLADSGAGDRRGAQTAAGASENKRRFELLDAVFEPGCGRHMAYSVDARQWPRSRELANAVVATKPVRGQFA